jgi:hypothetical protein
MTTEELAAAGLPAEPEVQNPESAQFPERHSSPAASGLGLTKMGRSDRKRKKSEMLTLMSKI